MKGEGTEKKRSKKTSARGRIEQLHKKTVDITKHRQAEEALRESRDHLERLTNSMWDAVFSVKMPERVIEWANDSFKLTGYEPEDCIGKTTEFLYPGKSEFIDFGNKLKNAINAGEDILHTEQLLRRKNGDVFPAEITTTIFREKGEVTNVTSIIRDITERKKAEQEIENLAKFPSENPYPVLRIGSDGTVLYANAAGTELLSEKDSDVSKSAPAQWRKATKQALNSASVIRIDEEHQYRTFTFMVMPVVDAGYCNFYGLDITDQKEAEAEREVTIELLHLINTPNQMDELMRLVMVFLKDWSRCDAVGIRLKEGEDFPYYVASGFSRDFIQAETKLCSVNELGEIMRDSQGRPFLECMCGNVISGRFDPSKPYFTEHGSFWTNSTTKLLATTTDADRLAKTRNRCNTAGYESVALIPLRTTKTTFGLLQFNSKKRGLFTPEKISLFERLADSLAIALAQRRAEKALLTSEAQLSNAMEIAKLGYWEYDVAKDLFTFNDHFYSVFRTTAEQVGGYTMSSARYAQLFVHPEDMPVVGDEIRKAIEATDYNYSRELEHRIVYADGEIGYITVRLFIVKDNQGRTVRTFGANQDITDRKKAEMALRESEEKYRNIFENAREAIITIDLEGNITGANKLVEEYGFKREELVGRNHFEFIAERYRAGAMKEFENLVRGGTDEGEIELITPRGNVIVEFGDNPIKSGEEIVGIQTILTDITERKKAEKMLRISERDLAEAQKIAHVGNWRWEIIPDEVYWSDEAYRLFGVEPGEPVDYVRYLSIVLPEDRDFVMKEVQDALDGTKPYENEHRIVRNGEIRIHHTEGTVTWDEQGRPIRLFGVVQDITESKKTEDSLRFTQFAVDQVSDAAFWILPDARFIYVNDAACRLLGYYLEELLTMSAHDIAPVFSPESWPDYWSRLKQRGSFSIESVCRTKDGKTVPVEITGNFMEFGGNQYNCAFVRDITERKKAEEELRAERDRAQKYLDVAGVMFVVIDAEQKVTLINQRGCEILGYSEDEIIGKNWFENFLPKQIRYEIRNIFNKLIAGEIAPAEYFENPVLTKDGQERLIAWHNTLLKDQAGNVIGTLRSGQDITDSRKAEERLIYSETKFRTVFESAGGAIFLTDAETGRVLDCNLQAEKLTGFTRDQLIGMRELDIYPEDKRGEYREKVAYSIGKDHTVDHESEVRHKDGRRIPVLVNTRVIEMWGKDVVMSHLMDITQRKQAATQALQARAELEHTARLITVGEMASGLAHELNQPLCAILNYTDSCLRMLKEQTVDTGTLLDNMEQVVSQTNRAGKIIRRIRNLVKKHEPHLSSLDINEIVGEIIDIYEAEAKQNRIIMQTKLAENMPLIQADRVALEQVLLNLVKNSFEAMSDVEPERRMITIETFMPDKDEIEVVVRDTGKGVPAENVEKVFDSFFTTKPEGLGIGLPLSRSIIEAHHGRIWYEPNPDVGASFKFRLPMKGG